ncbi:tyrosine-type recombinase/integrase [Salinicoccus sp. HZC-1]|uniref:tyrosine-type recombinase/integrase n=1 Tax=Salinicoccus sp. HZC-1 TaxID=3385497 RepID=UPI00398B74EE
MQWKHINLDDNMISVIKVVNTITSKIALKPKTEKPIGFVPIPQHMSDLLRLRKQNLYDQHSDFNDDSLLFAGKKRMDYKSFRRPCNRVFSDHTAYDLRHSYASYLADKGVDIFVLKDLLRHENIAITINTYSHIYDETRISAFSLLDN